MYTKIVPRPHFFIIIELNYRTEKHFHAGFDAGSDVLWSVLTLTPYLKLKSFLMHHMTALVH